MLYQHSTRRYSSTFVETLIIQTTSPLVRDGFRWRRLRSPRRVIPRWKTSARICAIVSFRAPSPECRRQGESLLWRIIQFDVDRQGDLQGYFSANKEETEEHKARHASDTLMTHRLRKVVRERERERVSTSMHLRVRRSNEISKSVVKI